MPQLVPQRSLNYSVVLHIVAVVVMFIGLPVLLPTPPDPTPLVMSVEVLPISDVSNVKPSDKAIQKEQHTPAPAKPLPPKPPTPPVTKAAPTPPAPTPPTPKPEEKHFDPKEGAEPVKDKPKPPEKEKPKSDSFDDLMKNLAKDAPKPTTKPTPAKAAPAATPGKDKTNTEENKTKSDAPYDASLPLSISEKDAIRSQFIPCWRAPIGAKEGESLAARVKVELGQDGTVKTAVLASDQSGRYASDPYFRAAADAAVRAVFKCSPLKSLPADKYGSWSTMEINFDPKDMM